MSEPCIFCGKPIPDDGFDYDSLTPEQREEFHADVDREISSTARGADVTIRLIFAWFDFWVGVFFDRPRRRIYVFPVPCIGLMIQLKEAHR